MDDLNVTTILKPAEGSFNSSYPGEFHFRRLLDKLPAAAYTCDSQGFITYFNQRAEEVWGRRPKLNDPVDRFCGSLRLYSTDGLPVAHDQCWMALALQGREYNGYEIVVERPDGSRLTALVHASPIQDDKGRILGAINVVVDISERRRAEELLQEADRHKNEFLAILSHELRTPLAPIRHALQVLHLKSPPDPELQKVVGLIDRQVRQMTRLVDDLLDVSRIIRRQLELRKEWTGLAEIVQAAVEASQPLLETCGQKFTYSLPAEPVYLEADRARLAQVISNMLNNAAKYTESDGRIWLTAERLAEEVVITVGDTGIGIPVEMQSRIFEMFRQADHSIERSQSGLGIGLTLTKRLVEMHEGTITVRSEGRGRGSEFVVRLPTAGTSPQALDRAESASERAAPAASLRVLVVDDDRDSAVSLSMLLQIMRHEVHTAHDGPQAVELAEEYRPDVVLLDIGLPGMNGYEVARKIRQAPWGRQMVLIALTGWGQEEDRQHSKEAGFDYHLVKPVEGPALTRLLASLEPVVSR